MADWAPQMPPELMQQALMRRPGVTLPQQQMPGPLPMTMPAQPPPAAPAPAPIPMGAPTRMPGGPNLAPPGPPGVGASGIPSAPMPTGASIPPPTPTPPQPSDDPGISPEMRKALQSTQSAQAGIETERQNVNTLMGQQPKAPSFEDYKPPLWKKIAAPFVGALAGRQAAEPAVNAMLYGPWNRAQDAYQTQDKAWQAKLGAEERVGVPLANDTARVAQEGFTNTLNTRREAETEKRDTATAQFKNDLIEMRNNIAAGKTELAQKQLYETAEKNKNNFDNQNQLLKVRQELADAARERADKAKSGGAEQNGFTASEQREYNAKTRRYTAQIDGLHKEQNQLVGIDGEFAKKRTAAIGSQLDELYGNLDKAEQDILSKRSGAGGTSAGAGGTGFQVPKGAPTPTKAGQVLNNHGKKIAYSADGKTWGPPQ